VQPACGRGDVLEVGECPSGLKRVKDLGVQLALSVVLEVVDRHRGDDRVEATERGQRLGQVVLDELDALIAREPLARRVEHDVREIEADSAQVPAIALKQRQQPAVAGAKVEHTANLRRDVVEQHAFAFPAARELVGTAEIPTDMFGGCPLLGGHRLEYERFS